MTAFEERFAPKPSPLRRAFVATSILLCLLSVGRLAAADDAGVIVDAGADVADLDDAQPEPSGDAAADAANGAPTADAASGTAENDASTSPEADATTGAESADASGVDAGDASGPELSADASADAEADAGLVTGVALSFPRGTGNDSYGCSCQSIGGTGRPAAGGIGAPLLAFLWMSRRRRR